MSRKGGCVMLKEDIAFTASPLDELFSKWFDWIQPKLTAEIKTALSQEAGEKLISPAETCKIFVPSISRNTLQAWTDAGHLVRYDIGGRIYYRYSEVIEAAKSLKKYKKL